MRKRLGISSLLSIIILIGIALVGGVLLNSYSNQFFLTAFSEIEYAITDLRLEKDTGGGCFFSVSLHNSGTVPIIKTKIKTTLDSGYDWLPINNTDIVQPLENLEEILFFNDENFPKREPCGNFTSGNTYSILVNASSADSSFATIVPIKVKDLGTT